MTSANALPGNVAFVVSLKNGVNKGIAKAWANINGSDVSVGGSNGGFPYLVDDRHRALVYKFFDAAVHPAYAVIDHCMRFAALLPAVGLQRGENTIINVVTALLRNTTQACPDEAQAPRATEVRAKRATPGFTPDPVPLTAAAASPAAVPAVCVPAFGATRTVGTLSTGNPTAFSQPRDLAFHPTSGNLWVGNNNTDR